MIVVDCVCVFNCGQGSSAGPVCYECDRRVYEMEKVVTDQHIYHKTCFRCTHCNRVLRFVVANVHKSLHVLWLFFNENSDGLIPKSYSVFFNEKVEVSVVLSHSAIQSVLSTYSVA